LNTDNKKLLKVERSVNSYNLSDEQIVFENNIDAIPLKKLRMIVKSKEDDPFLYDGYVLTEEQLFSINNLLVDKIKFDFHFYYYVLECTGVYEI
jgi:hypothetical protein